tara:strand:- start:392 stop:667 length:276 start_codon:yes stop_codon:yes gene_type:complete
MKVLAKRVVWIASEEGEDTDLELHLIVKDVLGSDEYQIHANYFGRYISEDTYCYYTDDEEDGLGTLISQTDWHEANPDMIGDTDKFEIRSA